jgi:hypothetical protein
MTATPTEHLYKFPINAIHLGEAFCAPSDGRPILYHLHVKITEGSLVAEAADGFCAGRMKSSIGPLAQRSDSTPPAEGEFFLSLPQLKLLRQMEKPASVGGPILSIGGRDGFRLGNPGLAMWVYPKDINGTFPNLDPVMNVEERKIGSFVLNPALLTKINRFAGKVKAEWMEFKAASERTAMRIDLRSSATNLEDYEVVLMPMVKGPER